jgi:DNA-binding NarL/FixJ family response regulator
MSSRNGGSKTRVLIAAPSAARRAELERIVQEDSSLLAAGSLTNLSAMAHRLTDSRPDVALVDLAEPDPQFPSVSVALQRAGAAVVVLLDDPARNWTRQILRAGVLGFCREIPLRQKSIPLFMQPEEACSCWSPEVIRDFLATGSQRPADTDFDLVEELTGREVEVLRMLAEGFANKEMASRLGISDHTVKFHISSILAKLGASSRTEAVTVGVRKGLILL